MRAKTTDPLDPEELAQILRVSPEPLRQYSDMEVHHLLCADLPGYLAYLDHALIDIADGRATVTLPEKMLFQQPGESGDFRVMPCVRTSSTGRLYKTVKLVGTNRAGQQVPDKISVGKACYLDPLENFISHQFDACLLSSIRTGACAALAERYLRDSNQPPTTINLVGAGRVSFYSALCLSDDRPGTVLTISDPQPERAGQLAETLQKMLPRWRINAADYAELPDCDLLVLATSSQSPVYHPDHFDAERVISLGADCVEQRELHDHRQWLRSPLFVDTLDSRRFGDLAAWDYPAESLTDLITLAGIANSSTAAQLHYPALFISTGSALLDNLTMGYLVELLEQQDTPGAAQS